MANLSRAAEDVLIDARPRRGAHVPAVHEAPAVRRELLDNGLISASHFTLTERGVIERSRITRRREDEAFA
jgi:hypothetical protein